MQLVFERSKGRFKSSCNILALAWTPYYNENKFRQALFDYHQRQLINLTGAVGHSINAVNVNQSSRGSHTRSRSESRHNNNRPIEDGANNRNRPAQMFQSIGGQNVQDPKSSRLVELNQRYKYIRKEDPPRADTCSGNSSVKLTNLAASTELDENYGKFSDFGWLVVGNVGKIVGITLTSTINPPTETQNNPLGGNNNENLIQFDDTISSLSEQYNQNKQEQQMCNRNNNPQIQSTCLTEFETLRPDRKSMRQNYNLRGHLEEIILVRWNELYQKLATVDSKGNVLIWCKINGKFTIQTPFYNRTKSVADFKWSNDGKTALICYTDSFILVGSSSGQRHWHSMLNLDDYHITCASWTPNDEQLLLGVSNGNIVVIDLPNNELTELVVDNTNIRAMCWSSSELILKDVGSFDSLANDMRDQNRSLQSVRGSFNKATTVVNQRRLSRDCSVFSRYRFCSQGPSQSVNNDNETRQQQQQQPIPQLPPRAFEQSSRERNQTDVSNILAIDFANNVIKLYDGGLSDPCPNLIQVNQESYIMQWSSDGKTLAVAGFNIHTTAPIVGCLRCRYLNAIKFYNQQGKMIYEYCMRYTRYPITALTWAHDDKRLFIATGPRLHCAKVYFGVPSLSLLTASTLQKHTKLADKNDIVESILRNNYDYLTIKDWQSLNCPIDICNEYKKSNIRNNRAINSIARPEPCQEDRDEGKGEETEVDRKNLSRRLNNCLVNQFQLPSKLLQKIDGLFASTIRQPFDEQWSPSDVVWRVPTDNQRHYCTLICYTSEREVNLNDHQYNRTEVNGDINDQSSHDQNKIFVLYIEFQGSLIPILRARRIGYLKPEFVIFDPDNGRTGQHRQRKVSDISQQQNLHSCKSNDRILTSSGYKTRHNNLVHHPFQITTEDEQLNMSQQASYCYSSPAFDNCQDLHQFPEPMTSNHSSISNQSPSDKEQYYNFDSDSIIRKENNQKKMADLISGRSHHQEPLSLPAPISNNPYFVYMMSMSAGHQQLQGNTSQGRMSTINVYSRPTLRAHEQIGRGDKFKSFGLSATLSEKDELVRIKSNIWGTKFKLINVANRMIKYRSIIGSVRYKASILHLQPRQIDLNLKDMSNYCCLCSKHHHRTAIKQPPYIGENDDLVGGTNNKHNVTLLDTPNATDLPTSSIKVNLGTFKKTPRKERTSSGDKVVLSIGDSLRIAPKLDQYQTFKQNLRVQKKISSPSSSEPKTNRPHRIRRRAEADRHLLNSYSSKRSINSAQYPLSSNLLSTTDCLPQNDDILTLSLGHGDQVRVEMSSVKSIQGPTASSSVRLPETVKSEQTSQVDEFLATNKTLKSIQTITKMIVDLSSKVDHDESQGAIENEDHVSPSKFVKLSKQDDDIRIRSPILAVNPSRYIAPQAPVHRPRRVSNRYHVDDWSQISQSASNTPLKSIRIKTNNDRRGSSNLKHKQFSAAKEGPLPPPPLPVPIGRRISSSARRFIDGSLRSLYSSTGYSTASDLEPEESEPLVKGGSSWLNKDIRQRFGRQSQPSSPMRSRSPAIKAVKEQADAFISSASSLKIQLMHKLRTGNDAREDSHVVWGGKSTNTPSVTKLKNSSFNKRANLHDSPNRYNSMSGSFNDDDDDDDNDYDHDDSDLDFSDSEDEEWHCSKESKRLESRNRKSSQSSSVRDLRELDASPGIVDPRNKPKVSHRRRRRNRRKSICPNTSCCCAKEFKLNNRPPVWNESSQVYQLDFGGRVTQESAKNLQIDFEGNLVSSLVLNKAPIVLPIVTTAARQALCHCNCCL